MSVVAVAAIALVGLAVWTWRLHQLAARRAATAGRTPWRISIVVPARDEAANLPALLDSLARLDPAPAEIIVVDDHSTDDTGAIARAAGARVIVPPPLPAGWTGKPWACHHGALAATGDALLFTDADTVHAPWSLARAGAALDDADLVTATPSHLAVRLWEKLQGAFHLLLLVATRAGSRARGPRRFAIGQYLLFRRTAYERLGGHAAAPAVIAEDLALARAADAAGLTTGVVCEPGLVGVRMYPEGPRGFWRGWKRSFRDGLPAGGLGAMVEVVAVIGWLLGVPLAIARGAGSATPAELAIVVGLALATAVEIGRRQRLVGALPWWSALAYPLGVLAFVAVATAATLDHLRGAPVLWRGRRIDAPTWFSRRAGSRAAAGGPGTPGS